MKFFGAILVCLLLAIPYGSPQQQTVVMKHGFIRHRKVGQGVINPLSSEAVALFFNKKWNTFIELSKRMQRESSNFCRANFGVLNDWQKRQCSCISIFSFMNQGRDAMLVARTTFGEIWQNFNKFGPTEYCNTRPVQPISRQLDDLCYCMTGNPSV
uniref:Scleritin n=1 Tax=Corallium rubrum TaxID=142104 RepID=I1VRM5_9CNID|nr:scleritin [Corallium rubrum]